MDPPPREGRGICPAEELTVLGLEGDNKTNRSAYGIRPASGTMDTREGNPLSSSSLRSSDAADEARETMRDVITCKKVRRIEN